MEQLKWGETVWDKMSKEELVRECQRMYSALSSIHGVLKASTFGRDFDPYWGSQGVGGIALEKARQALLSKSGEGVDHEMYRTFFRYADDLLFDCSVFEIGSNWTICDTCGKMLGSRHKSELQENQPCGLSLKIGKCAGTRRKLQWSDLDPSHDKG